MIDGRDGKGGVMPSSPAPAASDEGARFTKELAQLGAKGRCVDTDLVALTTLACAAPCRASAGPDLLAWLARAPAHAIVASWRLVHALLLRDPATFAPLLAPHVARLITSAQSRCPRKHCDNIFVFARSWGELPKLPFSHELISHCINMLKLDRALADLGKRHGIVGWIIKLAGGVGEDEEKAADYASVFKGRACMSAHAALPGLWRAAAKVRNGAGGVVGAALGGLGAVVAGGALQHSIKRCTHERYAGLRAALSEVSAGWDLNACGGLPQPLALGGAWADEPLVVKRSRKEHYAHKRQRAAGAEAAVEAAAAGPGGGGGGDEQAAGGEREHERCPADGELAAQQHTLAAEQAERLHEHDRHLLITALTQNGVLLHELGDSKGGDIAFSSAAAVTGQHAIPGVDALRSKAAGVFLSKQVSIRRDLQRVAWERTTVCDWGYAEVQLHDVRERERCELIRKQAKEEVEAGRVRIAELQRANTWLQDTLRKERDDTGCVGWEPEKYFWRVNPAVLSAKLREWHRLRAEAWARGLEAPAFAEYLTTRQSNELSKLVAHVGCGDVGQLDATLFAGREMPKGGKKRDLGDSEAFHDTKLGKAVKKARLEGSASRLEWTLQLPMGTIELLDLDEFKKRCASCPARAPPFHSDILARGEQAGMTEVMWCDFPKILRVPQAAINLLQNTSCHDAAFRYPFEALM